MTRTCTRCGIEKSLGDYYEKSGRPGKLRGACKGCHGKQTLANYHKNPAVKQRVRMKKYGLTIAEFEEMVRRQDGLCAVCKRPTEDWAIDHCHSSGRVRGLLCPGCNRGLGIFKDSEEILKSAIEYLSGAVSVG